MQVNKILIVDDDAEDIDFFTTVVKQLHPEIKLTTADNIEDLLQHLNQDVPDLLLIDSFIQQECGLKTVEGIRTETKYKNIPIIMYTGSSDETNISNAFKAGASAYIVKPHSLAEIKSVLEKLVSNDWNDNIFSNQYYMNGEMRTFEG